MQGIAMIHRRIGLYLGSRSNLCRLGLASSTGNWEMKSKALNVLPYVSAQSQFTTYAVVIKKDVYRSIALERTQSLITTHA